MSKVQRAFLMVVGVVALGAVPVSQVGAATTVLGTTFCVRADVAGAGGSGLIYNSLGVTNAAGINVDIICSLFRDNTTNTNGMQDLELSVNDPTTGSFFCNALSQKRDGMLVKQVPRQSTKTGEQIIDWGGSLNASVSRGHYAVRCTVPNGGVIHSIYYQEP